MILIPIATDAPIYHRPIGTVTLILINVLVYLATAGDLDLATEKYGLQHGNGLTPAMWVTSNFIHDGFLHLLGNMIFLWGFGLIVEGKVGWLNFIPIYLGIGVVECFLEQAIFYSADFVSVGASAVIFGLMTISLIWAPKNELSVFYWFFFRFWGIFDISIVSFSLLKIGLSIFAMILLILLEASVNSELLHLMGALVGGGVGVAFLKWHLVDCEGWDIFAVMNGTTPTSERYLSATFREASRRRRNTKKGKRKRNSAPVAPPQLNKATAERFTQLMDGNKITAAFAELKKIRHHKPEWAPTPEQLLALARGLRTASKMGDAIDVYREFLQVRPDITIACLELAEIFVFVEERPSGAMRLLDQCQLPTFTEKQRLRHQQAVEHAQRMIRDGVIEIEFES